MRLQIKIISKISSFSNKSEIRDANLGPSLLVNGFCGVPENLMRNLLMELIQLPRKILKN